MSRKIDTGYEGTVPDDFSFSPAGIEQMDRAVFELFDKRLAFQVKVKDQSTSVPVVFSTGERFALTRRKSPIRDKNNTLILPIISIHRKNIDTSAGQAGYGTSISFRDQQSYVIKRRLSEKDRDYQKIINKLGLRNQYNVASRTNFSKNTVFPGNVSYPGRLSSRRNGKNLTFIDDHAGTFLRDDIGDNIFEIITLPYPKFITATYEVTFWTQYMTQMNQIIETMMSKYDGQNYGFQIESKNGYKYVGYIKSPFSNADNFAEFSQDERVIKYTFSLDVPGYLLGIDNPGMSSPVRKFYSAPQIEFGYVQSSTQVVKKDSSPEGDGNLNNFILSDVENVDINGETEGMRGQGSERLVDVIVDPFTGEKTTRLLRVITRNQRSGETVASSRITVDLETTLDTVSD
tara:strand:- start:104 stop:1312 length:1209 start_codon:yes stop_codon:yes gene_type:complete